MSAKPLLVQLLEFTEAEGEELKLRYNAIYMTFWSDGKITFCKEFNNPTSIADIDMELPLTTFLEGLRIFVKNVNDVLCDDGYRICNHE